jgi:4,5-dihydroxyphthalate decarboxylase
MADNVRLTLACGDYDINLGLVNGSIGVAGVDLVSLTMPSPERHWRLIRHQEFDVCEFSMASYMLLRDRGELPYVAIPAFPHRRFRHSYLFVNAAAGITEPRQLEGKKIGLRTWQTTAGFWMRGILEDSYGLDIRSVEWFTQDEEDIPIDLPAGIRLQRVPEGDDVDRMLLDGELSALLYPELPPSWRNGDPRIKRLFPDAKAEEMRYFQRTGMFPIMHTVVVREDLLRQYPWLGMNLVQAFRRSKDLAWERMEDPRRVSLAWFREALEEQRETLGRDPWPSDLENNRASLVAICRYAHRQGLTRRQFTPEELFDPASLDDPPKYVGA